MKGGVKVSVVTSVLILCSCTEEESDGVYPAIAHIKESHQFDFQPLHDHAGGSKAMQQLVFGCAMNHLNESELSVALEDAPWRDVGSLQVLICREEEDVFGIFHGSFLTSGIS